jgi:peptidoglycan/xylan/chitin deacetylase (PgdA/CDA1 family)
MRVALTFDAEHPDRPHRAGVHDDVVALLAAERVRATFFLQGRWVRAYPSTAARIAGDGHLVGSHSYYHARMPSLSLDGMRRDVLAAEQVIRETAGVDPRPWFRCPWGAGWSDPDVQSMLDELGYGHVGWDVVAGDWDPERDATSVADAVLHGVERCDRDPVVLLHTWPEQTLQALPTIVAGLRAGGAELVGVDELEHVPEAVMF